MLDSLARRLVAVRVTAGDVFVQEGEASDRFYVIVSGLVEVTQGARVLRQEGPGDFFGEIGLLRDVPRTATISAVEDTGENPIEGQPAEINPVPNRAQTSIVSHADRILAALRGVSADRDQHQRGDDRTV